MTAMAGRAPGRSPARLLARHLVVPLAAGAICVAGFAPFYFFPAPLVGLALLFAAWRHSESPRQALLSGFAFGLGYFLAGVSWVFVSMHTYGGMPAIMAAVATFAFCAYLALFPALAGWLAARVAPVPRSPARVLAAAAAFTLLEWVRGWFLSGFSWIAVGASQVAVVKVAAKRPA